jgi:hypothetical protein
MHGNASTRCPCDAIRHTNEYSKRAENPGVKFTLEADKYEVVVRSLSLVGVCRVVGAFGRHFDRVGILLTVCILVATRASLLVSHPPTNSPLRATKRLCPAAQQEIVDVAPESNLTHINMVSRQRQHARGWRAAGCSRDRASRDWLSLTRNWRKER